MAGVDAAEFLDTLATRIERELTQLCVDAEPAERSALLGEFRRRAEDYQTLALMRRVPARLADSAASMREATGLQHGQVARRLLRTLSAVHTRVADAFTPAPQGGQSGQ